MSGYGVLVDSKCTRHAHAYSGKLVVCIALYRPGRSDRRLSRILGVSLQARGPRVTPLRHAMTCRPSVMGNGISMAPCRDVTVQVTFVCPALFTGLVAKVKRSLGL
ncbi:hypothetical protein J6590_022755 [Homalodisca vitripennis]|nr:hypothetical protein J6590_022755 [Homalodisca vitripennis]